MNAAVLNVADRQSTPMLDQYMRLIAPHLAKDITDLCVNRPLELWIRDATGWHRHSVPELSLQHCISLASTITSYRKKEPKPILSATLPSGERVHVVSPPASEPNTVSISIRKPSAVDPTLLDLETGGAFADFVKVPDALRPFEQLLLTHKARREIRAFLDLAVRCRCNILIVGKTGSGKTTVMKALAGCVSERERIVTIEDEHELILPGHPNKVHLFYGREEDDPNQVTAAQALAACLRMAPDRIWLAELRGPEAWEYIKSISTGHPGSLASMHANGAEEAFDQLAAHVKDSRTGAGLDIDYIRRRLVATIDIVLYFQDYKLREIYYDPEAKRSALA